MIISNEHLQDMNIIKYLEEVGLMIKAASETIKNKCKEQKGGFFGTLLGTLGAR